MSEKHKRLFALISEKGGALLEGPYMDDRTERVKLSCSAGHIWSPRTANLLYAGSWCGACFGNNSPPISTLHEWAKKLGGKCLSDAYINNKTNYRWECGACGGQWEASWFNVNVNHSWCPTCKSSVREAVSREAFRENFPGEAFQTDRIAIGMELDGYSERWSLAFEHDGEQHRERVEFFQRQVGDFEAQQERDRRKDDLCDDVGIQLIRIPDRALLPLKCIRGFVRDALEDLGYDLPPRAELADDDMFYERVQIARNEKMSTYLKQIRPILEGMGHQLVGEKCPTRTWPLKVKCEKGHEYETHVDNILRGRGCAECCTTKPKTSEEIQKAVEDRNYELVERVQEKVKGRSRLRLIVKCPVENHEPASILWDNFKRGAGCAICWSARRGAGKRAQDVDERLDRLGLTLAGEYVGNNKPTVFECAEGHRFTSDLRKVELLGAGKCCPLCVIGSYEFIELVSEFKVDTDTAKDKLDWKCNLCEKEFTTTYRGMRIRKNLCANAKCPSRT